jgi:cytochrome c556
MRQIRSRTRLVVSLIFLGGIAAMARADTPESADTRTSLGLTQSERAEFLAQMRQMLASVEGIVSGIGVGDREKIAAAARASGNRMARATPALVRAKMPQAFKELGGPTHMAFEEIAVRAESDPIFDTDGLAKLTGETMRKCMACHALFRAD